MSEICVDLETCEDCPKRESCLALNPHPASEEGIRVEYEYLDWIDEMS